MDDDRRLDRVEPFEPLSQAPPGRRAAWIVAGPLLWLLALVFVALVTHHTDAVLWGLLITAASALVSAVVLALVRAGRDRERARYAARR